MLQSDPMPLLSPFTRMTSQWLLDASVPQDDSDAMGSPEERGPAAAAVTPASASVCGAPSASEDAAPSKFSLLLDSRCLLPSWGSRRRPGRRAPDFGLPEGLLFRLREGADLLLEAGEAVGKQRWVNVVSVAQSAATLLTFNLHSMLELGGE